jgi:tetratricopeptide (TPR) repeat protein
VYDVTDEPILDPTYRRLPDHVKASIERLHHEAQTRPRNAIGELEALLTQYPRLPQLYNYLAIAYSRIGEGEKAEAIAQAGIQVNPDYLFTRLNYAEFCLHRKEYAKVAEVLDHKFDLHLLYPKRKRFHVSEVVNFMGVVGLYFCETQQRDLAQQYYGVLQKLAPNHPATRRLKRRLSPNLFDRFWARLRR